MKKRMLGRTRLQISEIGFGALEIGRAWGLPVAGDFAVPSEQEVGALLDRVLALGINLIDTAPAYMLSEERIGKYLGRRRKEFCLATKCGESFNGYQSHYDFSKAGTLRSIETSLCRLQTDYLDLVQIHCGPAEVVTIRRGETLEGMLAAKKEGKVRWVGASCGAAGAVAALDMNSYDVLQLPYSLLNRSIDHEILSRAAKANVGVIVREPLERGKLTEKVRDMADDSDPTVAQAKVLERKTAARGKSLSTSAIQFALRRPEVATVLVGTRSVRHLEEAIAAAGRPFDAGLLLEIDSVAKATGGE